MVPEWSLMLLTKSMDDNEKKSIGQRLLDVRAKVLENLRLLAEMRQKHYPPKDEKVSKKET